MQSLEKKYFHQIIARINGSTQFEKLQKNPRENIIEGKRKNNHDFFRKIPA
jgi:hypothetical protein